jgi:hypothetical protein
VLEDVLQLHRSESSKNHDDRLWIDLGAFQDLGHELISLLIGVEMIDDDTRAVARTLCLVCMGGNTFFSDATATLRHPNGCVEVTGGERIMSPRMSSFGDVIEQESCRWIPVQRAFQRTIKRHLLGDVSANRVHGCERLNLQSERSDSQTSHGESAGYVRVLEYRAVLGSQ